MEHKGLTFSVVQTANPTGWKWIVQLDERRTKTGSAPTRVQAVRRATLAIDNAIKLKRPSDPTTQ